MSKTVLITGANRRIGLEFVRQYLRDGWAVLACCRKPDQAPELHEFEKATERLSVFALDITDQSQIGTLAQDLKEHPIDVLINNAGVHGKGCSALGALDEMAWINVLHTNAFAPLKVSEAFLPHLKRGTAKTIVAITSKMGSIGDNGSGGSYGYRASKTALNAMMKSLAIDLKPDGIKVLILHPGWVKTDMGGKHALITTEKSVTNMRQLIDKVKPSDSGQFKNYDGATIEW